MTLLRSLVPGLGRQVGTTTAAPATAAQPTTRPAYDVHGDELGYHVTVQLPGVAKDGLEITAQDGNGNVTVTGRRAWTQPAEWTALYRETPRANFELTLTHQGDVDAEKISAELKDGVLRLTLPKAEAAKPRKIAVS